MSKSMCGLEYGMQRNKMLVEVIGASITWCSILLKMHRFCRRSINSHIPNCGRHSTCLLNSAYTWLDAGLITRPACLHFWFSKYLRGYCQILDGQISLSVVCVFSNQSCYACCWFALCCVNAHMNFARGAFKFAKLHACKRVSACWITIMRGS